MLWTGILRAGMLLLAITIDPIVAVPFDVAILEGRVVAVVGVSFGALLFGIY